MYLSTDELEKYILEKVNSINGANVNGYFFNKKIHNEEGIHIFSDNKGGYHFVISERGSEIQHKITDSVFEITFWALNSITSSIAFSSVPEHIRNSSDNNAYRKFAFNRKIELLEMAGENFKKAGELAVNEILRVSPYL